jgi:hypothetical protein
MEPMAALTLKLSFFDTQTNVRKAALSIAQQQPRHDMAVTAIKSKPAPKSPEDEKPQRSQPRDALP